MFWLFDILDATNCGLKAAWRSHLETVPLPECCQSDLAIGAKVGENSPSAAPRSGSGFKIASLGSDKHPVNPCPRFRPRIANDRRGPFVGGMTILRELLPK